MKYEETPVKNTKLTHKDIALTQLERVSTSGIVWHLIKRHKFGLVTTWALVVTVFYLLPFLPDMIMSLIK